MVPVDQVIVGRIIDQFGAGPAARATPAMVDGVLPSWRWRRRRRWGLLRLLELLGLLVALVALVAILSRLAKAVQE